MNSLVDANPLVDRSQLIPETVLPWKIDLSLPKWGWSTTFISSRVYYDRRVWKSPLSVGEAKAEVEENKRWEEEKKKDPNARRRDPIVSAMEGQIKSLIPYLYGSRNFVLFFSTNPVYIRKLYQYMAAAWVLSTNKRVEIADIQELIEVMFGDDEGRKEAIWQADLLFLPYPAKDHPGITKIRGAISNMLIRRKTAGLPTVTDLYVKRKPKEKPALITQAKRLMDTFGDMAFDLFRGDSAKHVYVNTPKESETAIE